MNKKKKETKTGNTGNIKQNIKKPSHKDKKTETSILKKSELSLIFLGASIITLIVFFIFFRPSVSNNPGNSQKTANIQALEKRIAGLEEFINANKARILSNASVTTPNNPSIASYQARVKRVEAALSVKFDALTERLNTMDKKIRILSRQINREAKTNKIVTKNKTRRIKAFKHIPLKKGKIKRQRSIFHTVKKGDTLYSISKKYNITINRLRKLNKLSQNSIIYTGDTLLIK